MSQRNSYVIVLCAAWLLPGLIGHDPWKPDEPATFGSVYELLQGGSWLVPSLAGEPFMEKPPLFNLTAALCALIFSFILPLHDAARIATGLWMAGTFYFTAAAARELHGERSGAIAVLLLLGCFGLVVRSHQLITDVAMLAGFAMAYYGCALALRRITAGGLWIGTGAGIGFLANGVIAPVIITVIALLLPLVGTAWRTRAYARTLGIAAAAALPWLTIWPALLYYRSPQLFTEWFWEANLHEYFGREGGPSMFTAYYLRLLPWYAFPAWLLVLWTLGQAVRTGFNKPAIVLPLTGFVVTLTLLSTSADYRELYALPMLVPLTLLAVPAPETLRRGATNAWYWFSVMTWTFFVIVFWVYWSGLELGVPARLHRHLHTIRPGYDFGFRWIPFLIGVLYTLGWLAVVLKLKRTFERPVVAWAAGITVMWGMLTVLFVGWADNVKSYRSMVVSMQRSLPKKYDCISSRDLGEAQRAGLHYYAGIITYREEIPERQRQCELLIAQGRPLDENVIPATWKKIWEGQRPGDKDERYRLYQRQQKK
jgi:4-amino-4-deoxy-L-arabinose transferase-like glycosyltransferase